ncbi:unnamed protein product [Prorocentrum cordatum]|uniref:Uncharacterized protein n=1 Tax=Prorocentrum cordatum TaxID=2364126 RepID=A0ABN9V283_9DINO|nr:unnamed protein product [Polarella glacialis]
MAAEDDRPAKLRRLSRLRAELPFTHCNAMAQFLASVERDGIPELGSRRQDIRDAREPMVGENTPCGKLHQNMIVGQRAVEICSPAAMLWYCSALPATQPPWQRALELPRPWHIIIYGDEIGAGSALAHVQNRKSWGIYWAIAEFGPQDAWFQLATMRAKTANDIQPHGLTMLLDAILAQFWPDQGHNFSAGISLRLRPDGATELIQMDLVRDIVASDATGVAVHRSEPDASRLQPMTAPLLDAICNRLIEGVNIMNKGEFQDWSFPGCHSISPDTRAIFGEKRARRQADADKLQAAVNMCLLSCSSVFGKETMAQKFHYLHHFANYARRWGHVALPSCWVLERKHKTSKRFANALQVNCLVNATRPSKAISRELLQQFGPADFVTSAAARCRYHDVKYGDVVLLEDGGGEHIAAEVLKLLSFTKNGHYYGLSLVLPYFFKEKLHPRASAHVLGGDADAIWAHTASIACSLAWAPREGGGIPAMPLEMAAQSAAQANFACAALSRARLPLDAVAALAVAAWGLAALEGAFVGARPEQTLEGPRLLQKREPAVARFRSATHQAGVPNFRAIQARKVKLPSVSNMKDQYYIIWVRSAKVKQWKPINIISGAEMLKNMKKMGENDVAKAIGVGGIADYQLVRSIGLQLYQQKDEVRKNAISMHKMLKYAKELQFGFKEIANNTEFNAQPFKFMSPKNVSLIPPEEELRNILDDAGDAVKDASTEISKVGDNIKGFFGNMR